MKPYLAVKALITTLAVFSLANSAFAKTPQEKKLNKNISVQKKVHKEAKKSQKGVDQTYDETQKLLQEYRITLRKIEDTKVYNQQLRELHKSQETEMVNIESQIEQLKDTQKGVVPLMITMLNRLDQFVALDVPFLPEERGQRIANLKKNLKRADVATSEKYRRIIEAFQIENEYGRTIEAYRGIQKVKDKDLTVDFLRVGRILLMYQSLDGSESGLWDQSQKRWVDLNGDFKKEVRQALKIARKQAAPDLLKLPIATPLHGGRKL